MRFVANGPFIPKDLLIGRDEGRVVFFCGAGVSRARAGLVDFVGLAKEVLNDLGVGPEEPPSLLLKEVREVAGITLTSADRVFGLLEATFSPLDIERAVAKALRPKPKVDLSAHEILLDLATTREGKTRLVTTNFDRLFESCRPSLPIWQPPRLPNPERDCEVDGIVHLHGASTEDYSGPSGDGFVLSTSAFGRAYLSDGWATRFIREVLDRYIVVFVGYTADDPPVQYLMEALNRSGGSRRPVYAFQSVESKAIGRWRQKGVEAIEYSSVENHAGLWETLSAWAVRARDVDGWYKGVIGKTRSGPAALQPFERGQVAHVVSSLKGARLFSEASPPAPAEWLCVFDPYRRYADPHVPWFERDAVAVDPFDLFGLDSDIPPSRGQSDDKQKEPLARSAWDAFAADRLDQVDVNPPSFRGTLADLAGPLPSRLQKLGQWIVAVADQPACLWWASFQADLHPSIKERLVWSLDRKVELSEGDLQLNRCWRYLFEAWEQRPKEFHRDWYDLKPLVEKHGWDNAAIRRFAAINRPIIIAEPYRWGRNIPPARSEQIEARVIVNLSVGYEDFPGDVKFPASVLPKLLPYLRENLRCASLLEAEIGSVIDDLASITPSADRSTDQYSRVHGLNGQFLKFAELFGELLKTDPVAARAEFNAWPTDDPVFERLRVWAAGRTEVASSAEFGRTIRCLKDEIFWSLKGQRDVLLSLRDRWASLTKADRTWIERRILRGRPKYEGEELERYEERRAWSILNRIQWLTQEGCQVSKQTTAQVARLKRVAQEWTPEHVSEAMDPYASRSGWVRTDTEYSELLTVPLSGVLAAAKALSGRTNDFLIERNPFMGLTTERPVLAFRVLTHAAKHSEFPEWAWRIFLGNETRRSEKPRLAHQIAARLISYEEDSIKQILPIVSQWMLSASGLLYSMDRSLVGELIRKATRILAGKDFPAPKRVLQSKEPDWATESINSVAGNLAQVLIDDPRYAGKMKKSQRFSSEWLADIESLLALPGDHRKLALVAFTAQLSWFEWVEPDWTYRNLVRAFASSDESEREAAWAGKFRSSQHLTPTLYARLKKSLLQLVWRSGSRKRGYQEGIAVYVLVGWGRCQSDDVPCISDGEFRTALIGGGEEFRMHVLWHLKLAMNSKEGAHWRRRAIHFFENVWPRQLSVKTPQVSARLCDLAFSSEQVFKEIHPLVSPLLAKADMRNVVLPELRKAKGIFDKFPVQSAKLLHAVLPDETSCWPYGIGDVLDRISLAVKPPIRDQALLDLLHMWESR